MQALPAVVGVAVVGATAFILKVFVFGKKKIPVTLKEAGVKYPLRLIDKEVSVSRNRVSDIMMHNYVLVVNYTIVRFAIAGN